MWELLAGNRRAVPMQLALVWPVPFAHVHSLISQAVATMDSCFGLIVTSSAYHSLQAEIGLEVLCSLPFTAEAGTEHAFKCQLHSIHVGAVGWEPHGSSNATCVPLQHALPLNTCGSCWLGTAWQFQCNMRWCGQYLAHVHSLIT